VTRVLRPTVDGANGAVASTPAAAGLIQLLGGARTHGVALASDETAAMARLYGYVKEQPHEKPPPPAPPQRDAFKTTWAYEEAVSKHKTALQQHAAWQDPRPFHQAGSDRNMLREAGNDGLRMVAWIARYLAPGEDPVRTLVQLAIAAGYDVDPVDVDWAEDDSTEEEAQ
jgi:hypothetical protein